MTVLPAVKTNFIYLFDFFLQIACFFYLELFSIQNW